MNLNNAILGAGSLLIFFTPWAVFFTLTLHRTLANRDLQEALRARGVSILTVLTIILDVACLLLVQTILILNLCASYYHP